MVNVHAGIVTLINTGQGWQICQQIFRRMITDGMDVGEDLDEAS